VNLFETRLFRDRRSRMLVQGTKVPREVKLLVNADFLVAEDCRCSRSRNRAARQAAYKQHRVLL
jgi:hypothetical protein